MRRLSHILAICLCSAPFVGTGAYGVVASNAGHNLTAFNPSNSGNNMWSGLTNTRDNTGQPTARADFGNCNAIVMRCATPKCANGGCVDANVAAGIVAGCVQSNETCAQYGNELVSYMSAQLVANSTAKVNAQRAASEAAAAAAQNAASQQTAQQIAQMQQQMQSQMAQMQQQMEQQNAQSQRQLQEALAAQQEQNAAALQSMTAAATTITPSVAMQPNSMQETAIERGVSSEVMVRQQITGQIMTEIEDAEVSLKAVKTAMNNSFEYAGCDARGNNCTGPKRVKKWRELATDFLEPYDNTIDKIYDALVTAQTVGVPLDDIYMMLNDSCNTWAQYMCPPGEVTYTSNSVKGEKGAPRVCKGGGSGSLDINKYTEEIEKCNQQKNKLPLSDDNYRKCADNAKLLASMSFSEPDCTYCTMLKVLTDKESVYEGWVYADPKSDTNQTVVACASTVLDVSKLFARRTKNKNGAGLVDIDVLDNWLHQTEPNVTNSSVENDVIPYCYTSDQEKFLKSSMASRSVPAKGSQICVAELKQGTNQAQGKNPDCPFISGTYAICDTHPYNNEIKNMASSAQSYQDIEKIKEILALKITVVSQQMYKQYEYLSATLRRLKTQLEKSVLLSTLEVAGAKSDGESSSSGGGSLLGGGKNNGDKSVVLAGAIDCSFQVDFERFVECMSGNMQTIGRAADGTNWKDACVQLQNDLEGVVSRLTAENIDVQEKKNWFNCKGYMVWTTRTEDGKTIEQFDRVKTGKTCQNNDKKMVKKCANEITAKLSSARQEINNRKNSINFNKLFGNN